MTEAEKHVRRRARHRCEYCQLPQSASRLRHQIDHIIARQHGGGDALSNLALCCVHCNIIRRLERLGLVARDRERQDF
ncbi:MAG: HNH endonuclease [Isosphaeraceae bacterium]